MYIFRYNSPYYNIDSCILNLLFGGKDREENSIFDWDNKRKTHFFEYLQIVFDFQFSNPVSNDCLITHLQLPPNHNNYPTAILIEIFAWSFH